MSSLVSIFFFWYRTILGSEVCVSSLVSINHLNEIEKQIRFCEEESGQIECRKIWSHDVPSKPVTQ